MNRIMTAVAAGALLALCSLAHADKQAAPAGAPPAGAMQPPKPAPELDKLRPMMGSLSCTDTMTTPAGPVKALATWKASKILGGMWVEVTFKVMKAKGFPGFEGNAFVGWDPGKRQYIFKGVDNMGGWIDLTAATTTDTGVSFKGQGLMMGQVQDAQLEWTTDGKTAGFKVLVKGEVMQDVVCKK